jgi:hypothetical protein
MHLRPEGTCRGAGSHRLEAAASQSVSKGLMTRVRMAVLGPLHAPNKVATMLGQVPWNASVLEDRMPLRGMLSSRL